MSQKLFFAGAHSTERATLTLRNISGENGSSALFMGALEV